MKKIKSYKGFSKDLTCKNNFQYEVGKEYKTDGGVEVCNKGFHACESPLEVFEYYDMLTSRFCEVEQSGKISRDKGSTKIASSKIKIKAELKLADMINLGVEWIKEATSPKKIKDNNTDDSAQIGSSGYGAQIGSSGYGAQIGSSGNGAQIGSSGDYAQIESSGEDSVVCCAGYNSTAKAKKGSWMTLSEWEYSEEKNRYVPVCVKTGFVDGESIKEDTWYKLVDGEFKAVDL